jgi:hypothetical protein
MKKTIFAVLIITSLIFIAGLTPLSADHETTLTVPLIGMKGRLGECRVEILDVNDNVVGSGDRYAYVNRDEFSLPVKVNIRKRIDDYDVLRVRVTFKNHVHIYSYFQLQDKMIVKIIGQDEFIKGTSIHYRVIVTNQRNNQSLSGAQVQVVMLHNDTEETVFEGVTDRSGVCRTDFQLPESSNNATLRFVVRSTLGEDAYDTAIKLVSGNLTYLVTDKPVYQPGQAVHIRTLSLQKPSLIPLSDDVITLEVEDSKGNKVFKKQHATDDFGTAYVQFTLADEVNVGEYTVRAVLGTEKVEKTITVEKYVLPKFKISLDTDKQYYMPGERIEGTIDVQYFFGKPVTNARVRITTYRYDIGFQKEAVIDGATDDQGICHFSYELPEYFVGEPLEKGDAFVRLDVEVTDKANHSEKISGKRKVVQDVLTLSVVPEGGVLRPSLENRVYVLVNYPDGTPCVAQVHMSVDGQKLTGVTDEYGIAEFYVTPMSGQTVLAVTAQDERGERVRLEKTFAADVDRDQIIMRMARGIFHVGQSVDLEFLATRRTGRVYIDIVKDNQTVLTKSVGIKNGRGSYRLNLSPDIAGSIWLHAYIVTPGGDIVRDTRFCYVHAANDLSITVEPDQDEYLPGSGSNLLFTVIDENGKPVVAALCVAIVDEAVFAVSELQPGLEKVYFMLEKQILEPRYEIHGFEPENIVLKPGIHERAENVMFSTLEPKEPFPVDYTTPQETFQKVTAAFHVRLYTARDAIYNAVHQYYAEHEEYPPAVNGLQLLIDEDYLDEIAATDPWLRQYRLETTEEYLYWFTVLSAGPDGEFYTADDITEQGWRVIAGEVMFDADEMAIMPMAGAMREGVQRMKSSGLLEKKDVSQPGEPRVREFFPETFIFEPALITDANGQARLSVTVPDAITTWRITSFASSQQGQLGSVLSSLRVFQEFFVDIDLPVALTEGDEISMPVALYNYLPREQKIRVVLDKADWYDILEDDEIVKTLSKDEVSVVYFPIRVKKIGYYSMLVKAYGEAKSDAIKRSIAVLPDGKRFEDIVSDRLEGTVTQKIDFPHNAIPDAQSLTLKIFPGIYSQIVEGLDGLLGVPFGCFEQTTSVTYPNILILDYLRQTDQIRPETEMTAEEYISLGYQRLLSFEVEGGGFSWFGDAPANKVLTAYGLMEFHDMAKVYEIDERVIERTAQWLRDQQNEDGSWSPDAQYLHAEAWSKIQNSEILPTAYVCWALGDIDDRSASVQDALRYLEKNLKAAKDPYVLALIANAFVAVEPHSPTTMEVLKQLVSLAKEKDDAAYWESDVPSITFSRGHGADIEATGLACYALIKSGKYPDVVSKGLTYLIRSKDARGTWHTTQGTIIALRSLVAALGGMTEDVDAVVTVMINGKKIRTLQIDNSNADVMHQISLADYLGAANAVDIIVSGEGSFMYELTRAYYIPWTELPKPMQPPFVIDVAYDRTELAVNDIVDVGVSVRLTRPGTAQMVMVDLGIPPGFEVQTPTLDELVGTKIQKYSITPRQLIIYLDEVSSKQPVQLSYSLKAKYPIRAKVRSSRVYEYYNTGDEGVEQPTEIEVSL